jgi:hypothetical protein
MMNAPHVKNPWPILMQWVCGVFCHVTRNYSDGVRHYAYCLRCGRLFGGVWGEYMKPSSTLPTDDWFRDVK